MNIAGQVVSGLKGAVPYEDETVTGAKIIAFEVRTETATLTSITANASSAILARVEGVEMVQGDVITLDGSMTDFTLSGRIIGVNG